eukprot:CAMPEP_0195110844 /NCGR_PEP_ID=MMETSP0448-20130528/94163_1 /TAXON_ID=66468 /ORGANISM="Heterocapsa triquestra, Strain CCMP 448" /LENGTH=43 /DNA_ID= /DNA_START= /DNA_END= /DNA_ORIENTATION=
MTSTTAAIITTAINAAAVKEATDESNFESATTVAQIFSGIVFG